MRRNRDFSIKQSLKHEGGWANHPKDAGGATNLGVTIGTLKSLGMDLDGDGDVDIADLRLLTESDAVKVYTEFYWNKVSGDLLPDGVDHSVSDFAINSGVHRAARYLQRAVGAYADGIIGPKTIAAVQRRDPLWVIGRLNSDRLAFMKVAKNTKTGELLWPTFGGGWQRRVDGVIQTSNDLAAMGAENPPVPQSPDKPKADKTAVAVGAGLAGVGALVGGLFSSISEGLTNAVCAVDLIARISAICGGG